MTTCKKQRTPRTPPRRFSGSHRTKWNHRPRQTPLQTADLDMIPEMFHPRRDRALVGGPYTSPAESAPCADRCERASRVARRGKTPGSPVTAGEQLTECLVQRIQDDNSMLRCSLHRPPANRRECIRRAFSCALWTPGASRPTIRAARNSRPNSVDSRILGEVLADFAESTTNCYNQPPAARPAR
jgi:hypothetical protein